MIEGFKPRNYRFKGADTGSEKNHFWLAFLIGIAFLAIIIYFF